MAFLTLEDLDGSIPIIVFAKTYAQYRNVLFEDGIVYIEGRASVKEDDAPSIVAMKIKLANVGDEPDELANLANGRFGDFNATIGVGNNNKKFRINIPGNLTDDQLKDLREFIKQIGGASERPNTDVIIVNKENSKILRLFINDNVIEELESKIGRTNIGWADEENAEK